MQSPIKLAAVKALAAAGDGHFSTTLSHGGLFGEVTGGAMPGFGAALTEPALDQRAAAPGRPRG